MNLTALGALPNVGTGAVPTAATGATGAPNAAPAGAAPALTAMAGVADAVRETNVNGENDGTK